MGCLIAFGGMLWLWQQWQWATTAERSRCAGNLSGGEAASEQRMKVNQAHNALFNSAQSGDAGAGLQRALSERYAPIWVKHSQFIVEHINAMTILAREHTIILTADLAQRYLQSYEVALQRCQQRLEYDGQGSQTNVMADVESIDEGATTILEQHIMRILEQLNVMHTISSLACSQWPHHGRCLIRYLRKG